MCLDIQKEEKKSRKKDGKREEKSDKRKMDNNKTRQITALTKYNRPEIR